jgi:rare lipoprotein A
MTLRRLIPCLVLLLAACSRAVAPGPPAAPARVGGEETGRASWYGHPYHGRRTASGEVYDMADLTAAHRTLPLGTRILVTNLDTGQALEVRINDRGPFVDGRILDLSWGAAHLLGAVGPGVIPVRMRILALPGLRAEPAAARAAAFAVQIGVFADRTRADALRQSVERSGMAARVTETMVGDEVYYRVRLGPYAGRAAAEAAAGRLASAGYPVLVVPSEP